MLPENQDEFTKSEAELVAGTRALLDKFLLEIQGTSKSTPTRI